MLKPPLVIAAACLALGLAGCASTRPTPIDPAQSGARFDARRLDDPGLRRYLAATLGEAASPGWDLDHLTLAALYFHPDLDLAYAKLTTAKGGVITARQRPNPSLSVITQLDPAAAVSATVGAAINVLVETGGKRGARTAEATDLVVAAREDLNTAAWQVRKPVRTALLDLWIGRQRTEIAARRLADTRVLVTLLEHRLALGEANALDVSRERANRDQAEVAWRDAVKAEAAARVQLAAAIGVPATALDGVPLSYDGLEASPTGPLPPLRRTALTQRADVKAALARYDAADAALRLQLANRYPNLSVGAGYNDQGDKKVSVPVTFDLPIFNQNQGPIAEAVGRRQEAEAQLRAVQAQVSGAIDAAESARSNASQSLADAMRLLAEQRERQSRTDKLFAAGELDRAGLVAGALEVTAADLARLDALAAERQALGQLEDALQRPLLGSAQRINAPPESARADIEAHR